MCMLIDDFIVTPLFGFMFLGGTSQQLECAARSGAIGETSPSAGGRRAARKS